MTVAVIPLTAGIEIPGRVATRAVRQEALAALAAAGWPTRRREPWRYTELEPLAAERLELTPSPADAAACDAVRTLLRGASLGREQLVLLDGQVVPGLGVAELPGVEITDTDDRWHDFAAKFARATTAKHYPLASLNTAFVQRGLWLRIPAGTTVKAPIHLVVAASTRAGIAAQPRIVIEVQDGATATIVQHFIDTDGSPAGWCNAVTQLDLAPHARLSLYRVQAHDGRRTHTSLLAADIAANAELTATYVDLGGRLVRNDIAIVLRGPGARTDLNGVFLAGAGQHVDNHTTIHHAAGETLSRESFRGIVGERGRGVFNGKVIVEAHCQRIDAQQKNDNLLLGEHAEIDTKPELEIYANDVKCSHGATVGELDSEQLFYLATRGLGAQEARRVLTAAFAAVILDRIGDDTVRSQVTERVTARLDQLMGA